MFTRDEIRWALKLYAVTDNAWLAGRSLAECVRQALDGGATFVQLRVKDASTEGLVSLAADILPLCREAGVPFVIDDDVEAVRLSGADGVHIGQSDVACARARKVLGPEAIIGVSAQTVRMAIDAQAAGADYLGVGAVAPTSTKPESPALTYEEFCAIVDAVDIPVVAIGGVNEDTMPLLEGTGVAGVAVVSALFAADDIEAAAKGLLESVDSVLNLPEQSGEAGATMGFSR